MNAKAAEKKKRKWVAEADHRDESGAVAVEAAAEAVKAALVVELVGLAVAAAAVVVPSAAAVASYYSPPQPQLLLPPRSLANRRGSS